MKVLHIVLEFPKFKTSGGLSRYVVNLIEEQIRMNLQVFTMQAGYFDLFKRLQIEQVAYKGNAEVYKIINPLPVAIPFGVREPKEYMHCIDEYVYMEFLLKIKPDIIHIHTIMGIHKEFFTAAEKLCIPIMYTTHDYFGLCARTNFINQNGLLCNEVVINSCVVCNANTGVSLCLTKILQSEIYSQIKKTWMLKKIRNYGRKKILGNAVTRNHGTLETECFKCQEYEDLYDYYKIIFNTIDAFHFNSTVSKAVYHKYLNNIKGKVINITHGDIIDHRTKNQKSLHMPVRISYIGSVLPYKGLELVIDVMDAIQKQQIFQWELHLYGDDFSGQLAKFQGKVFAHGKYNNSQLSAIMEMLDILIVPSICYETFGFVALEALSFGVPVLVSSYVGAKDLLRNAPVDVIFEPTKESLFRVLINIVTEKEKYNLYSSWINKQKFPFKMIKHTEKIVDYYKEILEMKR